MAGAHPTRVVPIASEEAVDSGAAFICRDPQRRAHVSREAKGPKKTLRHVREAHPISMEGVAREVHC